MGILSWVLVGLLAGFLAKWIIPSKRHKGVIRTLILGVIGGLLGGFVGKWLGFGGDMTGFDANSVVTATFGALFILILQRLFAEK
ncbi:GlsB/YeaQ/YmgE family stress response membrane protein [Kangiella sp. TOML190]|uniref:GlsB/YeaQ/YmgE family stress response membrane protein n=1 Tax=Kangiella sp. TOML190 TaxID=2931351 RepID=UPI002041E45E|nr:GlsB/YeaQ/YmgE family stress response membrane protein [Kangiella sp. TOML190]